MEKEVWTTCQGSTEGKEFPTLLNFLSILRQPPYDVPQLPHPPQTVCSSHAAYLAGSVVSLHCLVLVIKLLSLIAFYILFCGSGGGTWQIGFLFASCLLLGPDNEERLEGRGWESRWRREMFLPFLLAIPVSISSRMTLPAPQAAAVGSSSDYNFNSSSSYNCHFLFPLFYILNSHIRDISTSHLVPSSSEVWVQLHGAPLQSSWGTSITWTAPPLSGFGS